MEKTIKIVLIGDNHMQPGAIVDLPKQFPQADYFFHVGDSVMYKKDLAGWAVVQGNNDFYQEYPNFLVLPIGTHRFFLTHGHRYVGWNDYNQLAAAGMEHACDVVCFGHIHEYVDMVCDGVRLLSPGSVWRNRDGSTPCFMWIEVNGEDITATKMTYSVVNGAKKSKDVVK